MVDFRRDLIDIVRIYFSQNGISYKDGIKAGDLAARYCEMRIKRIHPAPRSVRFSDELNATLGWLAREADSKERGKALEAWNAVFKLWNLFTSGGDVTPFLSERVKDAAKSDGLLWDYGMHHFHLSSEVGDSGFIRRSDYLLFAIVADSDAFFVDVRKHRDPDDLQWVRQDLLNIVHTNWPEITGARVLRGVRGSTLTDKQKKELRRKNVISIPDLCGVATFPLGGGTMADGSSLWSRWWALKLLREVEWHEEVLKGTTKGLRRTIGEKGMTTSGEIDCRLVLLDSVNTSPELFEHLQNGDHSSKDLYAMGFAIVDTISGHPVTITQTANS